VQVTWTRKQLQETIARNKQWNKETSEKEAEIQEMRRKLEQC
jgi:predicted nuclease with TOPRIM domain